MSDLNFQNKQNKPERDKSIQAEKKELIAEIRKADSFYKSMNLDFFSIEELTIILRRLKENDPS